jgi:hypothetical protein
MKRNILILLICFFAVTVATVTFAQMGGGSPAPRTSTGANAAGGIDIAPIADQQYTGAAITPEPVIKFGNITLKKDVDYTLSYKDNTNVGNASITITGKGNYGDTKTINFKIVPRSFGGGAGTPAVRSTTAPRTTTGGSASAVTR